MSSGGTCEIGGVLHGQLDYLFLPNIFLDLCTTSKCTILYNHQRNLHYSATLIMLDFRRFSPSPRAVDIHQHGIVQLPTFR